MRFLIVILVLLLGTGASAQTPVQLFDQVWTLVEKRFYRADLNGVDSEALVLEARQRLATCQPDQASRVINDYLGRLGASHTYLYSSKEEEYYQLLDIFSSGSKADEISKLLAGEAPNYEGILVSLDEGTVVDAVPGGPAAKAGVMPGDVLLTVDSKPFEPVDSFRGKSGQNVSLGLKRDDETLHLVVKPERVQPREAFIRSISASAKVLPGDIYDIGYVRMWSYAGEPYHEELKRVLDGPLAEADGLVLDLRGRWGGAQPSYLELFNSVPGLDMNFRDGVTYQLLSEGWDKPVTLLIDETVSSGKELLAYGFLKGNMGPICGERTAGAVLGGAIHLLPGGHVLYLAEADVQVDGQRLEGVGVGPTHVLQSNYQAASARILELEIFKRDLAIKVNQDQGVRLGPEQFRAERMTTIDVENTTWAKRVVDKWGWPKESQIGRIATHDFWLIVQHATDQDFQSHCLGLLERAVQEGEASKIDYAYLDDRVRMHQKRPQLYGTQLIQVGDEYRLWPILEPEKVEARRREMDMQPLSEYVEFFGLGGRPLSEIMMPMGKEPSKLKR
jgi:C-terminal processing protease CtpA/Prc